MIAYRALTREDLPAFIALRIRQLREEGAAEKIDLIPALQDYYDRHLKDGTFVAFLAVDDAARAYGCAAAQITASDMGVSLYADSGFEKNTNFMQRKL